MYSTKAKVLKIIVLVIVFINGYSSIKEHCSSKVNPFSLGGAFPLASYV